MFKILKNDFCCKKLVAIGCWSIRKQGTTTNHVIFGTLKVKFTCFITWTHKSLNLVFLCATNKTSWFGSHQIGFSFKLNVDHENSYGNSRRSDINSIDGWYFYTMQIQVYNNLFRNSNYVYTHFTFMVLRYCTKI